MMEKPPGAGDRGLIEVRALGAGDGPALVAFFEACGSTCFCRYWSFEGDKNEWLARCAFEPGTNRGEALSDVAGGAPRAAGIVAMSGSTVVGWLKLAPSVDVPKIYAQRYYKSLPCFRGDRAGVHVLGCFLVHPDHRHRGVAGRLVDGAIAHARAIGARAIEAMPRVTSERVTDEELWLGPHATLLRSGFVVVDGDPAYPVVRLDLEAQLARGVRPEESTT